MAPDARKTWRLGIGYAVAIAALAFAAHYLGVQGPQFVSALGAVEPGRLILAFGLFAASLAINALAFSLACRACDTTVRGRVLMGGWLSTLLAKYVPVGLGHVLGRGLVLARYGVPARTTLVTGVVEQGFSLAICTAIAIAAYALDRGLGAWFWVATVGAATAIAVVAWRAIPQPRAGLLAGAWLGYALAMAPYAGAYALLVQPVDALKFLQALFAGTTAGVLAVLAPGGLGVRESIMASMSGPAHATAVLAGVVAARALILASECMGAVVGHALLRRAGRGPADDAKPVLYVAGLRASGSGYPNAEQTLGLLQTSGVAQVHDLGRPLPPELHLWKLRGLAPVRQAWVLTRLGLGNLCSLVRVLLVVPGGSRVYVPYPSLFFMWFVSWLPAGLRPACIVDAYISVWDSMFRDRGGGGESAASRWIRRIEARALRAAALVLVDTQANREWMIEDFGLAPACVRSLPLAIESGPFVSGGELGAQRDDGCDKDRVALRVLFVGTLIPLHGVPTILEAIRWLWLDARQRDRFHFRFVGDGQLGPQLADFVSGEDSARISWVREWRSPAELADEIAAADICLGVFGGGGKAARVLPFKLYMYLASGRAVISQAEYSLPAAAPPPPLVAVDAHDAGGLGRALVALADDSSRRRDLGRKGHDYFQAYLSSDRLLEHWRQWLGER